MVTSPMHMLELPSVFMRPTSFFAMERSPTEGTSCRACRMVSLSGDTWMLQSDKVKTVDCTDN